MVTDLAPQSDVASLLSLKLGDKAMGASPSEAPFTELFGLGPAFNVCPEGVDLCLGCNNIIFKLSVAADFSEVGPIIQLPNGFSESVVMGRVPSEHACNATARRSSTTCTVNVQGRQGREFGLGTQLDDEKVDSDRYVDIK